MVGQRSTGVSMGANSNMGGAPNAFQRGASDGDAHGVSTAENNRRKQAYQRLLFKFIEK